MSGIMLPTLGGIADLTPIIGSVSHENAGGWFSSTDYTCPANKAAYVLMWSGVYQGGTVPDAMRLEVKGTGLALNPIVAGVRPPVNLVPLIAQARVLLLPGTGLGIATTAGDATTDLRHSWSLVEFAYDEL